MRDVDAQSAGRQVEGSVSVSVAGGSNMDGGI